jgi:hypothetical protein
MYLLVRPHRWEWEKRKVKEEYEANKLKHDQKIK